MSFGGVQDDEADFLGVLDLRGGFRSDGDGSEPTPADTENDSAFTLGVGIHTVKAKCYKDDYLASETAVAVLPVLPTILTHLAVQTVDTGKPVTLTVEALGIPDPVYQWTKDGFPIAGETEPSLLIPAAVPGNAGDYQVFVSNEAGWVLSQVTGVVVRDTDIKLPLIIR